MSELVFWIVFIGYIIICIAVLALGFTLMDKGYVKSEDELFVTLGSIFWPFIPVFFLVGFVCHFFGWVFDKLIPEKKKEDEPEVLQWLEIKQPLNHRDYEIDDKESNDKA